jgi:RHS repeat-associated protein
MRANRFFLLSFLTLCFSSVAPAQSSETGLPPFGSFHGSNFDVVSLKSGNLHVEIPLWRLPQRAAPNTGLRLVYDMPTWQVDKSHPTPSTTQWTVGPVSGEKIYWNYFSDPVGSAGTRHDIVSKTCQFQPDPLCESGTGRNTPSCWVTVDYQVHVNYTLTDNHGTKHPFNLRHVDQPPFGCTDSVLSQDSGFALDGSGYKATIGNNANSVSIQLANDIGQFNGNLGSELSTGGSTTVQTDANGIALYRIDTVLDSNGNSQQFRVDFGPVSSLTSFCPLLPFQPFPSGTTCVETGTTLNLPQKLTMPNGKFYQFTWSTDGNADLLRIDLPTGGYIAYTYETRLSTPPFQQGGIKQYRARRRVTSRTVNDGTSSQPWTYLPGGIVRDPLGNEEVHTFGAAAGGGDDDPSTYEVQVDFYQGTAASGKLLRTIKKDYLAETDPGLADSTPHGTINARLIRTTTILGDAAQTQTKTETDYETLTASDGTPYTFLNPIEQREFAYGSGTPGALLRRTVSTYLHTGNQNYLSRNIVHRMLSTTVYDGSNHQVAQTVNEYDNYAHPGQPMVASNAIQHDSAYDTNFIYRGNVTAVSHWRNTDGVMLTSTNQYDDAGNLLSTIDPLGHKTSYDYTDSWGNGACTPAGQAKVFATTTTNALAQSVTKSHNSCTGTLASTTDLNGKTTTYTYDAINRLKIVTRPVGGGSTTYNYDDVNRVVTESVEIGNGVTPKVSILSYDGLGRKNTTQLKDPEGDVFTETTFDVLGRVGTVTNPHRTTASPTDGTTTDQYDALDRIIQSAPPDGTTPTTGSTCLANNVCTQYTANMTTVTDQAGKSRRSFTDALGRLIEVDEPGFAPPPQANYHVLFDATSNFVLAKSDNSPVWSTGTSGSNAASIFMQDDGNLVAYIFRWQAGVYAAPTPGSYPNSSCSIGTYLVAGQMLPPGKCIVSPHGQYFLLMNTDGNFFIYDWAHGTGTWGPGTQGHPGAYAIFQTDGNLVVYSASGVALWNSGTSGTYAERLDLNDDGRIIIWKSAWNSGTSQGTFTWPQLPHPGCDIGLGTGITGTMGPGQCFVSPNGHFELLLQTDGNLVINDLSVTPSRMLWSTNTGLPGVDPVFGWRTLYSYDALGNLTCVEQHGDVAQGTPGATGCADPPGNDATSLWRVRRFTYNSLSQLLTATNPESGTISYSYDNDGNLLQKTSPAPNVLPPATGTQTISFCYDAVHRLTGRAYSAQNCTNGLLPQGTAAVSYFYDAGTNGVGHMTSLTDQAGTGSYSYDEMGRTSTETRTLIGANNAPVSKSLSYEYNLDSSMYKLHYPSNAVVTYTPNSAGHMIQAADSGNSITYATGATYAPQGALTGFSRAGIASTFSYNKRLQPCRMTASTGPIPTSCEDADPNHRGNVYDMTYDFHLGNGDNGNVFGISNNKDTTRSQTFAYDALNRLTSAQNAGTNCGSMVLQNKTEYWGNSYAYDAWGNLLQKTITKCGAEHFSVTADAHNWLHSTAPDYQYDAAGNMTYDATASLNYTFDQENRLTGAAGYTYTYDGDGNRVRKSNGSLAANGTLYWYMTPGVVAETDLAGTLKSEYVFFDGERVARRDGATGTGGVFYYFSDQLKTASVITDSAGVIKAESDYYPWGGELQFINNDSNDYKFTGKKRDTETGLDYFGARYYSNALGRWVSADWSPTPVPVPYADLHNPQSLNLYGFVGGNPATKIDPDGHSPKWWQKLFNKIVYGHGVTDDKLETALKNDAKTALNTLTSHHIVINGKPADEALKGKTNKEIVDTFHRIDAQLTYDVINGIAALVPVSATKTLNEIDKTGSTPQGQQGGGQFANDGRGGGQTLPKTDAQGNAISYREWDVNPKQPGVNRGPERLVTGSDGSAWYTSDHYQTFTQIR